MAPRLKSIIDTAIEDFRGRKIVAFVGESHSGKTVVSALLKHALVNQFCSKKYKLECLGCSRQ